jgi:hypothetical protein
VTHGSGSDVLAESGGGALALVHLVAGAGFVKAGSADGLFITDGCQATCVASAHRLHRGASSSRSIVSTSWRPDLLPDGRFIYHPVVQPKFRG